MWESGVWMRCLKNRAEAGRREIREDEKNFFLNAEIKIVERQRSFKLKNFNRVKKKRKFSTFLRV